MSRCHCPKIHHGPREVLCLYNQTCFVLAKTAHNNKTRTFVTDTFVNFIWLSLLLLLLCLTSKKYVIANLTAISTSENMFSHYVGWARSSPWHKERDALFVVFHYSWSAGYSQCGTGNCCGMYKWARLYAKLYLTHPSIQPSISFHLSN